MLRSFACDFTQYTEESLSWVVAQFSGSHTHLLSTNYDHPQNDN